jgi:hypothetical protein
MKNAANIGDVPSISKTFNLVIQLKQSCKLYNSGPSKFFQFHFGIEVYFLLFFFITGWERRERVVAGFQ